MDEEGAREQVQEEGEVPQHHERLAPEMLIIMLQEQQRNLVEQQAR